MGDKKFHKEKIKEIINALNSSKNNLFLKCVSLFYLGVHVIDYYLADNGYLGVQNHGDRKNKLRNLSATLFVAWNSLFSISNDQRYRELTEEIHLQRMVEDLNTILEEVNLPLQLRESITEILSYLRY